MRVSYNNSLRTANNNPAIDHFDPGLAYIADPAKVNYTTNYVVFCMSNPQTDGDFADICSSVAPNSSDTTQWIASPLGRSTDMTWAGSELYVPVGDGPVGFYQETQSVSNVTKVADIITTGFSFYGNTAMVSIDGELESLWYAVATEVEGLWTVGWNATGGGIADAELLALRQVKAPNVDYPKKQ